LLVLPAFLLLIPIYAWPLLQLLLSSLTGPGWTLVHYRDVLTDSSLWQVLLHTFVLAGEVAGICVVAGYPVAYAMLQAPARAKRIMLALLILPLWTSTLVRAFAWMVILGRTGVVNRLLLGAGLIDQPLVLLYSRFAVLVGLVHVMLPYFILPLYGVMQRIDRRLLEAAGSLGAAQRVAFWLVFLPLSLGGVAGGAILVFILTIGFFVTPALLGGLRDVTYVTLIEQQVNTTMDWKAASAMAVVLFAATLVLVLLFGRLLGFEAEPRGMRRGRAVLKCAAWLARLPRQAVPVAAWTVIGFIILPLLILVPISFSGSPYLEFPPPSYSLQWYRNFFTRPDWTDPAWRSFEVAAATAAVAAVIGTMAAVGISRSRRRWSSVAFAFLISPSIMPTLVVAVAIYFQFVSLHLVGSKPGLILGHLVIAVPLVIVTVLSGLREVDGAPEEAARSLGAAPVRAFLRTTLHAIRPSIITAAFFAFLASFDDVVIALFISGTANATLPKKIWESVRLEIDPTVAAVSCLLVVLSLLLLTLAGVRRRA
jgi:putative spermidine/putrescine transport system permease protein